MKTHIIHGKTFSLSIAEENIDERIREIGSQINIDFAGAEPMFIVVMKGAMIFAADLVRAVSLPLTVDSISARSYGSAAVSSGVVTLVNAMPEVHDRHVILVEDIVETGLTLQTIIKAMNTQKPKSICIASLLVKPQAVITELPLRYVGFHIPAAFVVGQGLDYNEQGRNLRGIYAEVTPIDNG